MRPLEITGQRFGSALFRYKALNDYSDFGYGYIRFKDDLSQ